MVERRGPPLLPHFGAHPVNLQCPNCNAQVQAHLGLLPRPLLTDILIGLFFSILTFHRYNNNYMVGAHIKRFIKH